MSGGGLLEITAEIGGRAVSRQEVLAWEERRAERACRKLGVEAPAGLAARREALVARKVELGHEGLERKLARELGWTARSERIIAALSRGRRRLCTIELSGRGGSAEAVPGWYKRAIEAGDEVLLLAACPDHYSLRVEDDGLQQVIEATGGSPFASRIFLDDSDTTAARVAADPTFPVQWVAAGRGTPGGAPVGALRHQFRDEPGGFRARLTIELPAAVPPQIVHGHRWHLACEFSNWVEAASS